MFVSAGNPHRRLYSKDRPYNNRVSVFNSTEESFPKPKQNSSISHKTTSTGWTIEFWIIKFELNELDETYHKVLSFFNSFEENRKIKFDFVQSVKSKIKSSGLSLEEQTKLYQLMAESRTSKYRQFGCNHNITLTETQQKFLKLANLNNLESKHKEKLSVENTFSK